MTRLLTILTLCFLASNAFAQLSNNDVIKMAKSGLSDDIILNQIESQSGIFQVDIDNIIELKQNGVSDTVINVMIDLSDEQSLALQNHSIDSNYVFPKSGIYAYDLSNGEFTELDFTQAFNSESNELVGWKSVGKRMSLPGDEANYSFNNELVEFYFNFDNSPGALDNKDSDIDKSLTPNEFILIKLQVYNGRKFNYKEQGYGLINTLTQNMNAGIPNRFITDFKYERVSEQTFRVYFPEGLKPGQYCFVHTGDPANGERYWYTGDHLYSKVFDFGIE